MKSKVKAEEIIKNIEAGKQIDINNSIIVGKLISTSKDIKNRISITNADFENEVDLSGLTFHENVNLSGSIFHENVNLSRSTFHDTANLSCSIFNKNIVINGSRFIKEAIFYDCLIKGVFCSRKDNNQETLFENIVSFRSTIFQKRVEFHNTIFKHKVTFASTQFYSDCYFPGVKFLKLVSFNDSKFSGLLVFRAEDETDDILNLNARVNKAAIFMGSVDFIGADINRIESNECQFNNKVNFTIAKFQRGVKFCGCHFKENVIFAETIIEGKTDFFDSHFYKIANFNNCKFDGIANFTKTTFYEQNDKDNEPNVIFTGAIFENVAIFNHCYFSNTVHFNSCSIKGNAFFINSHFVEKKEGDNNDNRYQKNDRDEIIDFIRNAFFIKSRFLEKKEGDNNDNRYQKNNRDEIDFSGLFVEGKIDFEDCIFNKKFIFIDCLVRGNTSFRNAQFLSEINLIGTTIESRLNLKETKFDGKVFLKNTHFSTIRFSDDMEPNFPKDIDLQNCKYEILQPIKYWKSFIENIEPYNRRSFIQLEMIARNLGKDSLANEIYRQREDKYNEEIFKKILPDSLVKIQWLNNIILLLIRIIMLSLLIILYLVFLLIAEKIGFVAIIIISVVLYTLFARIKPTFKEKIFNILELYKNQLWKFLSGYGTETWRILIILIICFTFGTTIFTKNQKAVVFKDLKEEKEEKPFTIEEGLPMGDAAWLSADLILPVDLAATLWKPSYNFIIGPVDLPCKDQQCENNKWGFRYIDFARLLNLSGWIAVPIGIGSLTGLLKNDK
ncbi:pentapeptide repeat-containing protein [Crocosphaera sp.]|uniref:pentapeptide repeat-containing protein n=1 Tax=Crocosphaera sp. TaxID=2729996 RepID=UPI00261EA8E0|nr:pentapeptide repeat-containing protein [Crocosphaera sp.]MDJ0579921.1 pentapeptide repeat-containing protein [Crocosphaera sp.]